MNHIVLKEDIDFGEGVRSFIIEGKSDGKWREIFLGGSIGHKFIHQFESDEFSAFLLKILEAVHEPK